jgi:CheY-like chemotaxis protein
MSEFESQQMVFSLPALLEEIHALFVPRAQSKGLSFHIDYDAYLPKTFLGHRGSLYRVVLNLVGNAVKFTAWGEVRIRTFIASPSDDNTVKVGIEVQDTGPGIPEDKYAAIFEKLQRLTPSYEGKVEGSGIGLYIVDQYVKHMQGEIKVESTLGQGSTFTVFLPMEIAANAALPTEQRLNTNVAPKPVTPSLTQVAPSVSVTQTNLSADAPLLLLVEDNPMIQLATQALLHRAGFRVDLAGSGAEALQAFLPGKYAFIYMDIGLPDIHGYEVAAAIRKKEQDCNATFPVPIIALTAHGAIAVQTFCGNAGMQGILSKPLSAEQAQKVWQRFGQSKAIDVPGLTLLDAESTSPQPSTEKSDHTLPIIDLAETVALIGSEAQANELFGLLAKDLTENDLPQIDQAVQQKNYAELRKHLHSLIGALCYAKLPRLQHAVLELQAAARNASPTISAVFKQVKREIGQFIAHYQAR